MSHPAAAEPIRLALRVSPGGSRAAVIGRYGNAWKVRVVAAPERGRANDSVVALLASTLGLKAPDVRIVSGTTSRNKTVELTGLTLAEVESRLTDAQEGAS
ncbi:DUF167 domain-containing protein [Gaiella sp.]|uniref:DUF167 domain-containing protein n=1 Tax=Gaiella sp. TaxID=2663207 RepID=UPI003267E619